MRVPNSKSPSAGTKSQKEQIEYNNKLKQDEISLRIRINLVGLAVLLVGCDSFYRGFFDLNECKVNDCDEYALRNANIQIWSGVGLIMLSGFVAVRMWQLRP